MKSQRNHDRHHVGLILALVGLIGAVVLVLAPSRRASAQAAASWPAFASQYNSLTNQQYVDMLLNTAGVTLSNRQTMING